MSTVRCRRGGTPCTKIAGAIFFECEGDSSVSHCRNVVMSATKKSQVQEGGSPETPIQCWKSVSTSGIQSG